MSFLETFFASFLFSHVAGGVQHVLVVVPLEAVVLVDLAFLIVHF